MPRRTRFAGIWSAEHFERVMLAHPRIEDHTRQALGAVLVDGKGIEAAAAAAGLARQRLFRRLEEVVGEQLPDGWAFAVVCLPMSELQKVRELEQRCKQRLKTQRKGVKQ